MVIEYDVSRVCCTVFQVVNEHDSSYPPPIDYVSDRILSEGVNIVTDPGFLACCDCTDNCQVRNMPLLLLLVVVLLSLSLSS